MLEIIPRQQLDTDAWNACVATSDQRIVYGYAWYLDAVLPAPSWKWVGLVLRGKIDQYQAVMPIPLRRKQIMGVTYEWVVHQPLFCQFLAVFSRDPTLDPAPFVRVMHQQFRYGSVFAIQQLSADLSLFDAIQPLTTHLLNLSVGYEVIRQNYTPDRTANLLRALRHNWTVIDSNDPEPLLRLFRENHAHTIPGEVANWAYDIFRALIKQADERGLATLRYTLRDSRIEAGALFVAEGSRIIYLFNAASDIGRRGNARTLLIDQVIRENAGKSVIFDFESPEKPSVQAFYRSFGAVEEPFRTVRWNRLTPLERLMQRLRNKLHTTPKMS